MRVSPPIRDRLPHQRAHIYLLVFTLLFGIGLQLALPQDPHASLFVGLAVMACSLLAAFTGPAYLRDVFGGFRFAALLLAFLASTMVLGTLIPQAKPAVFYQQRFGHAAAVIVSLGLVRVFHSVWFAALLGLLAGGLIVSAIRRLPPTRRNVGFFACHAGLLLVLAGGAVSSLFAVRGRIALHTHGAPATTAEILRDGLPTGEEVPLGFSIALDRFDIDRYERAKAHIVVYTPEGNRYRALATFEPDLNVVHRLPDHAQYRIRAYYPDADVQLETVEGTTGGVPALAVAVDDRVALLRDGDLLRSRNGRLAVRFGVHLPVPPPPTGHHVIALAGRPPHDIEVGSELVLEDGTRVRSLAFYPSFYFDLDTRRAQNSDEIPLNPVLEVQVVAPEKVAKRRFLFADAPQFHDAEGPAISYTYVVDPTTSVLVSGTDRAVVIRSADGDQRLDYSDGLSFALPDGQVVLGPLYQHAQKTAATSAANDPGVLVEVTTDGVAREAVLVASSRDAIYFGNGKVLTFERAADEVKNYRSVVAVTQDGGPPDRLPLATNAPVEIGGWTLYQADFRRDDPTYSGIDAVRDPGVPFVFTGFALIALGIVALVYVTPRLRPERGPA